MVQYEELSMIRVDFTVSRSKLRTNKVRVYATSDLAHLAIFVAPHKAVVVDVFCVVNKSRTHSPSPLTNDNRHFTRAWLQKENDFDSFCLLLEPFGRMCRFQDCDAGDDTRLE